MDHCHKPLNQKLKLSNLLLLMIHYLFLYMNEHYINLKYYLLQKKYQNNYLLHINMYAFDLKNLFKLVFLHYSPKQLPSLAQNHVVLYKNYHFQFHKLYHYIMFHQYLYQYKILYHQTCDFYMYYWYQNYKFYLHHIKCNLILLNFTNIKMRLYQKYHKVFLNHFLISILKFNLH